MWAMSSGRRKARKAGRENLSHKITATVLVCVTAGGAAGAALLFIGQKWRFPGAGLLCFIFFSGIAYGLARFAAWALGVKFTGQVRRITDEAKAIAVSRDLGRRIQVSDRVDELSHLQSALNDMLEKLQGAFERERRFVSDASHELRTPVAVVKGYVDILRGWGGEKPEVREEALEAISEEAGRMGRMIDGLLKLARMDREGWQLRREPVASDRLLERVLKDARAAVEEHPVQAERVESFMMEGDGDLLLEALRALVENAAAYSEPGSPIVLSAGKDGEWGILSVADQGMGVPEADRQRIFNRLARTGASRKKNDKGSGIGLSLVKGIATAHGGDAFVADNHPRGSVFSLRLPLAGR